VCDESLRARKPAGETHSDFAKFAWRLEGDGEVDEPASSSQIEWLAPVAAGFLGGTATALRRACHRRQEHDMCALGFRVSEAGDDVRQARAARDEHGDRARRRGTQRRFSGGEGGARLMTEVQRFDLAHE
jgi:hypothetical protein